MDSPDSMPLKAYRQSTGLAPDLLNPKQACQISHPRAINLICLSKLLKGPQGASNCWERQQAVLQASQRCLRGFVAACVQGHADLCRV